MSFIKEYQLDIMLILIGTCMLLPLFVLVSSSLHKKRKHALIVMEIAGALLLFFDRFTFIYDGNSSTLGYYMVRISNFIVYSLDLVVIYGFNLYLIDLYKKEGKVDSVPFRLRLSKYIACAGELLIIISQFTGLYYTFSEDNIYHRSDGFIICYIIPVLMMLLDVSVIIQYIKKLNTLQKVSLLLFSIGPLLASAFQMFHYGVSLLNIVLVILVIVLYVFSLIDMDNAFKQANKRELQVLRDEQKKTQILFEQTASALATAIDAKDKYTHGHSTRVAYYSEKIARHSGMSDKECEEIYYAALLHDVGKIGVPDSIITKDGKLTPEEFNEIKRHPVIGKQILSSINQSPYLSIGANYHHERYDGKGYPEGLKGEDIPLLARIISVADAYDAMTSKRSYRDPLPQHIVREEIVKGSGTQFDPEYAKVMLHLIDLDEEYEMAEREESKALGSSRELECSTLRSQISDGVLVNQYFSTIGFVFRSTEEKISKDDIPTLLLFDSLDGIYHDTDYLRKITNHFEYGAIRIDGKADCPNIRNIKKTVTPLDTASKKEIEHDMKNGLRVSIDAVRCYDHMLIRIVTWFEKIEFVIALPNGTQFAYIGLTGENCHISEISINRSEKMTDEDYIPRIAEKISYINVPQGDIPNIQIDGWRYDSTNGITVRDGMKITFHTMSLPTARLIWHCPYIDLFYSEDKKVNGDGYREFSLVRLDGESWDTDEKADNTMHYSVTEEFKGWDDWKQRNKEGLDCTVTFNVDNNVITVTGELGGVITKSVTTINDNVNIVYASLTGDQCALTNIRIS